VSAVCPYCRGRLEGGYGIKVCHACATPHHEDCLTENGGCSVFGCVNAPGDESKVIIRLEDLGNDFPSRGDQNAATLGEISPAPAWQFRIPGQRAYPAPPRLPWGYLVLFLIMTGGLSQVVWDLVLAIWVRKVQPQSRAIYYYSMVVVLHLAAFANLIGTRSNDSEVSSTTTLFGIGIIVLRLMGRFSMRKSLEDHFDEAGPMGLSLSEVMTFFFGSIYFQYHLNRIMRQKEQRHAIA